MVSNQYAMVSNCTLLFLSTDSIRAEDLMHASGGNRVLPVARRRGGERPEAGPAGAAFVVAPVPGKTSPGPEPAACRRLTSGLLEAHCKNRGHLVGSVAQH